MLGNIGLEIPANAVPEDNSSASWTSIAIVIAGLPLSGSENPPPIGIVTRACLLVYAPAVTVGCVEPPDK